MKRLGTLVLGLAAQLFAGAQPARAVDVATAAVAASSASALYQIVVTDIDGKPAALERDRGRVLLIVNVASKCGFTPQYEGLEKLYKLHQPRGLEILGFPANDFWGQEPGTNEEIKGFCRLTYGVSFPMFEKVAVSGETMHPLYRFLTEASTNPRFPGAISWNFNKFLIGRDGTIVARFGSTTPPDHADLLAALEVALAAVPAPVAPEGTASAPIAPR